jgi:hypothetical protein
MNKSSAEPSSGMQRGHGWTPKICVMFSIKGVVSLLAPIVPLENALIDQYSANEAAEKVKWVMAKAFTFNSFT